VPDSPNRRADTIFVTTPHVYHGADACDLYLQPNAAERSARKPAAGKILT
jgi:hypothetical protein